MIKHDYEILYDILGKLTFLVLEVGLLLKAAIVTLTTAFFVEEKDESLPSPAEEDLKTLEAPTRN